MSEKKELKNIYEAIAYVMKEVEAIGKNSQNKQQGFKFRGIDAVYNSMHDLMSKAEIVMLPEVIERHRDERQSKAGSLLFYTILRIKYNFIHSSGSSVSCIVEGEGMDTGDKSVAKAMSIAQKYALFQTFLIPTEDSVDPDAESYEVVKKEQVENKKTKAEPNLQDRYTTALKYIKECNDETVLKAMKQKVNILLADLKEEKKEDAFNNLAKAYSDKQTNLQTTIDDEVIY
jgi:hypothetical protein